MKRILLYFKKDIALNIFIMLELVVATLLLGVVISMMEVAQTMTSSNNEATTLLLYLLLAIFSLLILTTITDKVVNREKNKYFYSVCFALGESRLSIFKHNAIKTALMTLGSTILVWIIVPPIVSLQKSELFFEIKEMSLATIIIILYMACMVGLDAFIIFNTNLLKNFEGGSDNND